MAPQQWLERQRKSARNSTAESACPPINIHLLPTHSQSLMVAIPSGTPPPIPNPSPRTVDPIVLPDLPLDKAVKESCSWQQSRVDCERDIRNWVKQLLVSCLGYLNLGTVSICINQGKTASPSSLFSLVWAPPLRLYGVTE